MDRLSIVLTLAVGAAITGSLVTLVLALGLYSWTAILVAAVAGFALSWPVSFAISRKIKQRDPNWDERRIERTETIPKPNAPEVLAISAGYRMGKFARHAWRKAATAASNSRGFSA